MKHVTEAALLIQKARTGLLLDHPFFGTLLFRLQGQERRSIKTMATDGVSLFFNPDFVAGLTQTELRGTLAHEVMHPALQHHTRRGNRSKERWNMACDYAINPLLMDAGLTLPQGVLIDRRFQGMSAEQIYNLIESEENVQQRPGTEDQQGDPRDGAGAGGERNIGDESPDTPGGVGQVLDAPQPEPGTEEQTPEEQARDWKIAVEQAETLAKLAGKAPAGLQRTLDAGTDAAVDWGELLRRLWSETTPADYSWMRPSRRHVWNGLYLPGVIREGVGEVAIAVDCSGSISKRQLGLFEAAARSILEGQRPSRVYVLYFDAVVHRVDTYEAGEPIRLTPVGGGGTRFEPCFEWLDEQGIVPQTMVFLTDLEGSFPREEPMYPVLWASTSKLAAPFGQVIPMAAA
ncbi:VWA-like domain-containing protein [Acidicapsa dinghuensis]|uniref:VWA-like domain-containing protein n=1 Tax=Acidicapsa dinghuensis TaxID=2218256 RepID=A0ABW1EFQ6_9BACT|nr:VWA-like domain-containing protein [Acidicapsa dinghuensis]